MKTVTHLRRRIYIGRAVNGWYMARLSNGQPVVVRGSLGIDKRRMRRRLRASGLYRIMN